MSFCDCLFLDVVKTKAWKIKESKIWHIHYTNQNLFSQVHQMKVSKISLTFFSTRPTFFHWKVSKRLKAKYFTKLSLSFTHCIKLMVCQNRFMNTLLMKLHFTFFTVACLVNKHVVQLVKYLLNLSVCAHVRDLMLYQYHYIKAAEAKPIQTNLKVKHVWNSISYAGTKNVSPPKMLVPLPHLLLLHQLLTFSCFSKQNLIRFSPTYKKPPPPFYSRLDSYGR